MEYRKLIKFGNSSHVISIPNEWIKKNSLKKGDVVYVSENGGNELVLAPKFLEPKKELQSATVNAENLDPYELRRRIVSLYISGYDVITITGQNLLKNNDETIRKIIDNLVALEIIEQTKDKIVTKDLLDPSQFSLEGTVRRVNLIVRAMMDAIRNDPEEYENLTKRDLDINRLIYLSLRMIKKQFRVKNALGSKVDHVSLLGAWDLLNNLEHLADELKRIGRNLKRCKLKDNKLKKEFLGVFDLLVDEYDKVMKCYFTKDINSAYSAANTKEKIVGICNKIGEKNTDVCMANALEKLKASSTYARNIARVVYELV